MHYEAHAQTLLYLNLQKVFKHLLLLIYLTSIQGKYPVMLNAAF